DDVADLELFENAVLLDAEVVALGLDLDFVGGVLDMEKCRLAERAVSHDSAAQGERQTFLFEDIFVLFAMFCDNVPDFRRAAEIIGIERNARVEQELRLFLAVAEQLLLTGGIGLVFSQGKSPFRG
ncbi:MAG: hypothetical protein Q8R89_11780, partial [Desulfomicrobium sp.]|nr:hypothetical protein [Desulfomicrobium sp.]